MRVIVADERAVFRSGLVALLGELRTDVVPVEAAGAPELLERLAREPFALALVSASFGEADPDALLASLRASGPATDVVVVLERLAAAPARRWIDAGVAGLVDAAVTPEQLRGVLDVIGAGGVYLPRGARFLGIDDAGRSGDGGPDVPAPLLRERLGGLSDRQHEVLLQLLRGLPNKRISTELGISPNTVKAHLSAIFRALGARSRTEAVCLAQRTGLSVDPRSGAPIVTTLPRPGSAPASAAVGRPDPEGIVAELDADRRVASDHRR